MKESEQLAFCQALYSRLGSIVSTKDPNSLRSSVDEEYKALYESTGAKTFEVRIDDVKVGTYSVKVSKPRDAEIKQQFVCYAKDMLKEWLEHEPQPELERAFVEENIEKYAEFYFNQTGELPFGCDIEQSVILAQPERYAGGMLKVDPPSVLKAMGNRLGASVAGLLGGGGNESD